MIYLNVDVETTGTDPRRHAMISLGAVAHASDANWQRLGEFSQNLKVPEGLVWDPHTRAWWDSFPEALVKALLAPSNPDWVMGAFCDWIEHLAETQKAAGLDSRVAMVAYPTTFDIGFIEAYASGFAPERWKDVNDAYKARHGAVDLASLIMGFTGKGYHDNKKKSWPKEWTHPELHHTHVAVEDAREQAYAFIQIMRAIEGRNDHNRGG